MLDRFRVATTCQEYCVLVSRVVLQIGYVEVCMARSSPEFYTVFVALIIEHWAPQATV